MPIKSVTQLKKFRSGELSKIMKKYKIKGRSKSKAEKIQLIRNNSQWNQIRNDISIPVRPKRKFSAKQLAHQREFAQQHRKKVKKEVSDVKINDSQNIEEFFTVFLNDINDDVKCKTDYKIITSEILGKGAQGTVFLSKKGNERAATKVPTSKSEVEISKILSGNVGAKVLDIYECKLSETTNITIDKSRLELEGTFMVMELLQGEDLDDFIQEDIFITRDFSKKIVNKIKQLHTMGFAHNDLDVGNIFIIMDELEPKDVVIIDFGKSSKHSVDKAQQDFDTLLQSVTLSGEANLENVEELIELLEEELIEIMEKQLNILN